MLGLIETIPPYPLMWSADFRTAVMISVPISVALWSAIFALAAQF